MLSQNIRKSLLAQLANIESSAESKPGTSADLGKAYAAMFLSVINYGYNVANRRPMPFSAYSNKESGQGTTAGLQEKYIRSEESHPSRVIVETLEKKLEKLINDEKNEKKFIAEHKGGINEIFEEFKKFKTAGEIKRELEKLITAKKEQIEKKKQERAKPKQMPQGGKPGINQDEIKAIQELTKREKYLTTIEEMITSYPDEITVDELIKKLQAHEETRPSRVESLEEAGKILRQGYEAARKREMREGVRKEQTWLGQMPTPEEVVEQAFALLPLELVKKLIQEASQDKMQKEEKMQSAPVESPEDTRVKRPTEAPQKLSESIVASTMDPPIGYDTFIERRKNFTSMAVQVAKKQMAEQVREEKILCEIFKPKSDYPCVMFNLTSFFAEHKIDDDHVIEKLNNIILSYYCGLLNDYSIQRYGEAFIWTETQNSFGSIRPSLTDTGVSFRLSPGLVPDDFATVIANAYRDLNKALNGIDPKKMLELVEKDKNKYSYGTRGAMHLVALREIKAHPGEVNSFNSFIDQIIKNKKNIEQLHKDAKDFIARYQVKGKNIVDSELKVFSPAAPPKEAKQLRAILLGHARAYIEKQSAEDKSIDDPAIAGLKKTICEQLNLIIRSADESKEDYSRTCSDIENLMRLLKITEDINRINKYAAKEKASREQEIDDSKSDDSVLSMDAFPARSGMASLKIVLETLIPYLDEQYEEFLKKRVELKEGESERLLAEVYFEIKPHIVSGVKHLNNAVSPVSHDLEWKPTLTVRIIDLAQFPVEHQDSKKSPWSSSWDKIKKEDKPDILIVDITSATAEEISTLIDRLQRNEFGRPAKIITFSSDNKFAQGGVDLVSMGEVRIYSSKSNLADENYNHQADDYVETLARVLQQRHENTISARNERRLLENLHIRRSLEGRRIEQELKILFQKERNQPEALHNYIFSKLLSKNANSKNRLKFLSALKKVLAGETYKDNAAAMNKQIDTIEKFMVALNQSSLQVSQTAILNELQKMTGNEAARVMEFYCEHRHLESVLSSLKPKKNLLDVLFSIYSNAEELQNMEESLIDSVKKIIADLATQSEKINNTGMWGTLVRWVTGASPDKQLISDVENTIRVAQNTKEAMQLLSAALSTVAESRFSGTELRSISAIQSRLKKSIEYLTAGTDALLKVGKSLGVKDQVSPAVITPSKSKPAKLASPPKTTYTSAVSDVDFCYHDGDINAVLEAALPKEEKHQFVVKEKPKHTYYAVTPPVNPNETALPIDYFLNKNAQRSNTLADIYQHIHQEFKELTALFVQDPAAGMVFLEKLMKEKNLNDYDPSRIINYLYDINFDEAKLAQHIQNLRAPNQHDVFEDLDQHKADFKNFNILMPFHNGGNHWLTCEIKIARKEDGSLTVGIYAHDPYGGGELAIGPYSILYDTIQKRLKGFFPEEKIEIQRHPSSCARRQTDSVSCGVIVAQDIREIVEKGEIESKTDAYANIAVVARQEHVALLKEKNKPFAERHSHVINAIKQGKTSNPSALQKSSQLTISSPSDSLNVDQRYHDGDINAVLDRALPLLNKHKFIIEKSDAKNGSYCAITPAVNPSETALPVDYFLNKKNQRQNSLSIFYKSLSADTLNQLKQLLNSEEKTYDKVQAAILIRALLKKANLEGYAADKVIDFLSDINFEQKKLEAHIEKLNADGQSDVFDDLAAVKDHFQAMRILMPYHNGGNHWLTCEININKCGDNKFIVDVYSHDPFGGGQLPKGDYAILSAAVAKRLNDCFPRAEITIRNQPSPYRKRQADHVSCGVIVTQDIIEIASNSKIVSQPPAYEHTALALRQQHVELVGKNNPKFCERQREIIHSISPHSATSGIFQMLGSRPIGADKREPVASLSPTPDLVPAQITPALPTPLASSTENNPTKLVIPPIPISKQH